MVRICVFCGSSFGARPAYRLVAERVGTLLGERRVGLVYGGGNVGLMGALADAALASGAEVIGVMPRALVRREIAHLGLTELREVASMHARKALMAELSDCFLALPGGYGTLEEFCEMLTWSQLGVHRKACGLLNVEGYWDPLIELFDRAVRERFIRSENRGPLLVDTDPARLIDTLLAAEVAVPEKWVDRSET